MEVRQNREKSNVLSVINPKESKHISQKLEILERVGENMQRNSAVLKNEA